MVRPTPRIRAARLHDRGISFMISGTYVVQATLHAAARLHAIGERLRT